MHRSLACLQKTIFKGERTSFDHAAFTADKAADFTRAQFDLFVDRDRHLEATADGAGDPCVPALPTFKHTTFGKNGADFTNAKLGFCVRAAPLF